MRLVCNAKCFANHKRRGICDALQEKCVDSYGKCKFYKAEREDSRTYIPVKAYPSGRIYFKEAEDDK